MLLSKIISSVSKVIYFFKKPKEYSKLKKSNTNESVKQILTYRGLVVSQDSIYEATVSALDYDAVTKNPIRTATLVTQNNTTININVARESLRFSVGEYVTLNRKPDLYQIIKKEATDRLVLKSVNNSTIVTKKVVHVRSVKSERINLPQSAFKCKGYIVEKSTKDGKILYFFKIINVLNS